MIGKRTGMEGDGAVGMGAPAAARKLAVDGTSKEPPPPPPATHNTVRA